VLVTTDDPEIYQIAKAYTAAPQVCGHDTLVTIQEPLTPSGT
jgi:hypothetical protein